ncbi:uncharacterized protein CCOS01_15754 [Colletotrichum costaricense]|uniref:Uncharacterized protein n=1 Tax=Colletotrichum costaricense TaxID=1209916 RepID=A0AAJ0DTD7_9PEZI|nr:uncharacterized protein CCOS01_15754 [Colletotrichum costaricense]KAK1509238.1 hypothetical protein CCOS01_15754 [Colletotrichum costaricense]
MAEARASHQHPTVPLPRASKQWMEGKTDDPSASSGGEGVPMPFSHWSLRYAIPLIRDLASRGPPEPGRGTWNLDFSTLSPPGTFCRSDVLSDKIRYVSPSPPLSPPLRPPALPPPFLA